MVAVDSLALTTTMVRRGVGTMALAEISKVSPRTITAISKRDDVAVRVSTIIKLAKALQIDPVALVKGAKKKEGDSL